MDTPVRDELAVLAEHLPFDLWVRDQHDRCVYANPVCRKNWPGLVGKTPEETDVPADVVSVWKDNNARARAGEVVLGDVEYVFGTERRVVRNLIAPVYREGQAIGTVGVNLDITDQRRAESAALERQAIIAAVFDAVNVLLGVREIDGDDIKHLANNRASLAALGVSEAPPGLSDAKLGVPLEARQAAIRAARRAAREHGPVDFERSMESPAGRRAFRGQVVAIEPTGAGGAERFLFIAEDLTELRSVSSELLRAERLASLGTLAASVAHEIKNPAMIVSLILENLRTRVERLSGLSQGDRFDLLDVVADAEAATGQITRLVTDLGRLATPSDDLTEDVQLDEVVSSVLGLSRARIMKKAHLEVDLGCERLVRGSAVKLAQVVLNLAINAAQAVERTGRRGLVTIRTRCTENETVLEVDDDGPGIDPALADRLFQPFVTGSAEGQGLGLYVCRQIVTAHGGTIVAQPREAGGAVFRVTLPAL